MAKAVDSFSRQTSSEGFGGAPVVAPRPADQNPAANFSARGLSDDLPDALPSYRRPRREPFFRRIYRGLREWAVATFSQSVVEDEHQSRGAFSRAISSAPPWLVSLVVHLTLLVFIGLLALEVHNNDTAPMAIELGNEDHEIYAETIGNQLDDPRAALNGPPTEDDKAALSLSSLPEVDNPFAAPPKMDVGLGGTLPAGTMEAPSIGLALSGREQGRKMVLHAAYGGTKSTQESVTMALEWIARNQSSDGLWSLRGPYADGSFVENKLAATAMAMLALQGDGQTHQGTGPYQKVMRKACDALLKFQERDGSFMGDGIPRTHSLYTHAQCTIAVCELYGMTNDSSLRDVAQKALDYCTQSQSPQGGWRYEPGRESDTSVTGWFVMALQSGRMAKLNVPEETLKKVTAYLDSAATGDGYYYGYMPGAQHTPAMTAEALLCRQYLGWARNDPRLISGVNYLNQSPVNWSDRNAYYWYYATQVAHHMGGEEWMKWNKVMRQVVPENQVKTGREKGSWDPVRPTPDQWGGQAGRLYVTCLSTYMLEVYYRHLPLYAQGAVTAVP